MAKNINGPLAELGLLVRKRAEVVAGSSNGEIGRLRAAYTVLMVTRVYAAFHRHDDSDYLPYELTNRIRGMLPERGLGGGSNPFDMLDDDTPDELRVQIMRSAISLCNGERQEKCVKATLDILVAFDLYMRHHWGRDMYEGSLSADDVHEHFNLRQAFMRVIAEVPELALNSQLGAILSVQAA